MLHRIPTGSELYEALLKEGFRLPENCADVKMIMPIDGMFQLMYTVNLTGHELAKVGRALERIGNKQDT